MQSAPARAPGRRWLRWGRAVLLGVVLAALQLLLLSQSEKLGNWAASAWPAFALGALLYLFIPTLEGFLSAWRTADVQAGVVAGCIVGGVSFIVLAIVATMALVALLATPPPVCPPDCPRLYLPPAFFAGIVFFYGFVLPGIGGVLGGALGGWIGGLIGQQLAQKPSRRSATTANPAP